MNTSTANPPDSLTAPQELKLGEPQNRAFNTRTGMWYVKGQNFTGKLKSQATVLDTVESAAVQAQFENVAFDTIVLAPSGRQGGKPSALQIFHREGAHVRIGRMRNGDLAAEITAGGRTTVLPAELLGLAAGKDAWMRRIMVRCSDCGKRVPAGEMECRMCDECYNRAGEENAKLDAED